MIHRKLSVRPEIWQLKEPFRISRGTRSETHVIIVEIEEGGLSGRGEAVPYGRYDETVDSVISQIGSVTEAIEAGMSPEDLQTLLPAGAARNAVDCALWDLQVRRTGTPIWELLRLPQPKPVDTAVTISLNNVEAMAEKAKYYKDFPLLKIKLDRENIIEKITAIRREAPKPKIIIDPNESWMRDDLVALDDFLDQMNISLLEQPLAAGLDDDLKNFTGKIPICADESCHTREDLPGLVGKYQVINIKLDKTGGMTEAVKLQKQAQNMGFGIMVGCMVSTSLAMAPAFHLAFDADFVDLDGPIILKNDRAFGLKITQGRISGYPSELWGGSELWGV